MSVEIVLEKASDIPMKAHGHDTDKWGGWSFDGVFLDFNGHYPVDMRYMTSSPKMLDLIMQVAGKKWADDACLAGLVRALDTIFYPQSCLCSCGRGKRLTKRNIRRKLDWAAKFCSER